MTTYVVIQTDDISQSGCATAPPRRVAIPGTELSAWRATG